MYMEGATGRDVLPFRDALIANPMLGTTPEIAP
jgi:hypothetical protein